MNIRELAWFRDNISMPALRKLLINTQLSEGLCCIDNLDIALFDGRSCGVDSEIKASGLVYRGGKVEEYSFDAHDISFQEFADAHKDCLFISDGKLHLWNQLEEMEISSVIRGIHSCAKLFPELTPLCSMHFEWNSIEYVKMQHLHQTQSQSLDNKIHAAESRAGQSKITDKQKDREDDSHEIF